MIGDTRHKLWSALCILDQKIGFQCEMGKKKRFTSFTHFFFADKIDSRSLHDCFQICSSARFRSRKIACFRMLLSFMVSRWEIKNVRIIVACARAFGDTTFNREENICNEKLSLESS